MKKFVLFFLVFSLSTGYRSFCQCGSISMIGEFNGWAEDYPMYPDFQDSSICKAFIYLDENDDPGLDGIVELKFRQDSSWEINWGSQEFPEGYGVQNGANIPCQYGNYFVTFECLTGHYVFQSTCGAISIIGEFNDYLDDLYMDRSFQFITDFVVNVDFNEEDDNNQDGYVDIKFRENGDWTYNWGGTDFPAGYGIMNGPVIPVPYGNYNVSFDCETVQYLFSGPIGITDLNTGPEIILYPNPARETLFLKFDKGLMVESCRIGIYDLSGRLVMEKDVPVEKINEQVQLDIHLLDPGFYNVSTNIGRNGEKPYLTSSSRKIIILK